MEPNYAKEDRILDALAEVSKLILDEFIRTKDIDVATAGHVVTRLMVKHAEALGRQLDKMLDEAGL
jgi:hypothetical protein